MKLTLALLASLMIVAPTAAAGILGYRDGAIAGADRLLEVQFANGAFPWQVGTSGVFANVQGISAMGLLEAYKITGDPAYLEGAEGNRDWLVNYWTSGSWPANRLSASGIFYLAHYGVLTQSADDLTMAADVLDHWIADPARGGGSGAGLINFIIQVRKNQGHTNLGLWDAMLFVRAAADVGDEALADEMATALATQTIVDPWATSANWYEFGLTGIVIGLAEADPIAHQSVRDTAATALKATQADDGSFPVTFGGVVYAGDVQATAYAALALLAVGEIVPAHAGCHFLAASQDEDGGWGGSDEYAEVDSEATWALANCVAPLPGILVNVLKPTLAAVTKGG